MLYWNQITFTFVVALLAGCSSTTSHTEVPDRGIEGSPSMDLPDSSDGATSAERATMDWPEGPREAVKKMTEKYGTPSGVTESRVVWNNPPAPWHQIIVYKETISHKWPAPHEDYIEHVVLYSVPEAKFDELAEFDGSIIAERTAGTLAARCHKEWANLIALNLAHDVIQGTKTVEQARDEYAKAAMQMMNNTGSPAIASSLMFDPMSEAGARNPAEPHSK